MKIFISYRRSDSADAAGRIFDRLKAVFGAKNIFKDVDSIPVGADFEEVIAEQISDCDAVIVIIGQTWASISRSDGIRRLHDPSDFVRIEIEQALRRRVPLVPALVGNADMPVPDQLPESIRTLTRRHAIPIRPDPDFHRDMDRLIKALKEHRQHNANRSTSTSGSAGMHWATRIVLSVLSVISLGFVGKKQEAQGHRSRPEDHDNLPNAGEARRQADAAALWFLSAGIGNVFTISAVLGFLLINQVPLITWLLYGGFPAVTALFQFLASSGLKNLRGRVPVVIAIVIGFALGGCEASLACTLANVFIGLSKLTISSPFWLLVPLILLALTLANFFASVRGILVLKNASVREELGRPGKATEEIRSVFSKRLVIGLVCGFVGVFFLVLVITNAAKR